MYGEIGGAGAAGECAATYGSLGVCEKAGGTAKVCLTAHADSWRASGAVDRWWVDDERHDIVWLEARLYWGGCWGRGGPETGCCRGRGCTGKGMVMERAVSKATKASKGGKKVTLDILGWVEEWHGRAERMGTEADELECQFWIGYR